MEGLAHCTNGTILGKGAIYLPKKRSYDKLHSLASIERTTMINK